MQKTAPFFRLFFLLSENVIFENFGTHEKKYEKIWKKIEKWFCRAADGEMASQWLGQI
jgi:hypothetical protein